MEEVKNVEIGAESNNKLQIHDTDLAETTEKLLHEVYTDVSNENVLKMPIGQLAALGTGISSLIPALNAVTQNVPVDSSGLYRIVNMAAGDTLKPANNMTAWGAIKTASGKSKLAQLQSVESLTGSSEIMTLINPATVMMAVALFSIEQKLNEIAEVQQQILTFLETEKESEIEADVETLSDIVKKYKLNWDNEHFMTSNHKMVLDIQRTARKNMLSYQKKVDEIVKSKKLVVVNSQVNAVLRDLLKKFKYYRLSLYTLSMASMMEIMLSGNFKEEYINGIKDEIAKMSESYRELFERCSLYLEKMSEASVESSMLKGIGSAGKAVGKFIGTIPVVKNGPVDEFLTDSGAHISKNATETENNIIHAFSSMSSPKTAVFIDRMKDIMLIFNHTEQICFDNKQLYLITD